MRRRCKRRRRLLQRGGPPAHARAPAVQRSNAGGALSVPAPSHSSCPSPPPNAASKHARDSAPARALAHHSAAAPQVGLFSLGIIPYINASIVLQLMSTAFPALKKMQREDGPQGRARFQYYQKLAAFVFAIAQVRA